MRSYLALISLVICVSSPAFAEDNLEEQTNKVIRSACHGYALDMIPDFLASLRTKLKKDSLLCKDVREQGDDVDVQSTLKRYLTQRDLDRIYGKDWGDVGADEIAFECQQEWKCGKVRKDLTKQKKNMSQKQYDQVAEYCRGELAEYDCIDHWVNTEWIAKGIRTVPKRKLQDVGGSSLDDFMSPKSTRTITSAGSIDDLMGGGTQVQAAPMKHQPKKRQSNGLDAFASLGASSKSDLTKGEVGFDNIYAGQKQVKVNGIKQRLFDKGETIASKCQCAFRNDSCFKSHSYDYEQLTSAFNKTDKTLESKKTAVCNNWKSVLRGKTSDSESVLNSYLKNSDTILSNLDKLDKGYDSVVTALNGKESEIKREIERRKREQEEQQGGFDLTKFVVLGGVGGIMGLDAGMSSAEVVRLLSGAAQDSMEGVEGISNFNQGMQEITSLRVEQMQSVSKINQQVIQMNSKEPASSHPVLPSNNLVNTAEINRPALNSVGNSQQGGLCNASGPYPNDATEVIFWDGGRLSCSNGSSPRFHYGAWWYSLKCGSGQSHRKNIRRCQSSEMPDAKRAACEFIPTSNKEGVQLKNMCLREI